jgi:hypothetical protein
MRFLSYLVTLLAVALLASCGGGGGSPGLTAGSGGSQTLFTTAPSDLTLTLGSAQDFTVGGGTAPYTAVSNDTSTAVSGIAGTTLTLGAVQPGTAAITLRDAKGAASTITVTVKPARALTTSMPGALTLGVGNGLAQSYAVSGGVAPYTVTSNNPGVLSAVLNVAGNGVVLTGLAKGAATVSIKDSVGTALTSVVTVSTASTVDLFTTAPSALTLATKSNNTYSIGGGSEPYTVTSSNTSVVAVTQSGSSFTLQAVAIGAANIVIRDSAGTTITIAVAVNNTQLSVNPATAHTIIGLTNYTLIIGGAAPFTAVSTFPSAVTVSVGSLNSSTGVFTADPNGNVVKMIATQAVDPAQIVVTDSQGNSANFSLTATSGQPSMTFAPSQLQIGEGFSGDITLLLYGATGSTNVFTTFPGLISIVTTPVTGNGTQPATVTVHANGGGICATGIVTITAIDGSGASATSDITIVDNTGNNIAIGCP